MSDQQIREIQLGGKQLVFLFMASVVVAVAIFLLGVSVGRGVRSASADAAAAPTDVVVDTAPGAPVELPPATETKPEDLQYHDQLQGTTAPPEASPAATPPASPERAPAAPETATPPVPGKPVQTAAASKQPAAPVAAGGWFVQANSFRSRENADRQAAQLRSKGYSNAAVYAGPGGLYRVRLGPFADKPDATRTAERLRKEEGFKPSIQP